MSNLLLNYYKQHYNIAQANVLKVHQHADEIQKKYGPIAKNPNTSDEEKRMADTEIKTAASNSYTANNELNKLQSLFETLRIQTPQPPSNEPQDHDIHVEALCYEEVDEQKFSAPKELIVPNFNLGTLLYDSFLKPYENIKLSDGKTGLNEAVIDLATIGVIPIGLAIVFGIHAPLAVTVGILRIPWLAYKNLFEEQPIRAAIWAVITYPIVLAIVGPLILAGSALILAAAAVALVTRSISTGLSLIASGAEQLFNNSTNPNKRDEENETLVDETRSTSPSF